MSFSTKVSEETEGLEPEIISYWHPNVTINIVYDETRYMVGGVPEPLNQCEDCSYRGELPANTMNTFFPIFYIRHMNHGELFV